MNHETNSFSPLPTPLASFAPMWGDDAKTAGQASRTAMGAFLAFADTREAEITTPVFAMAFPSGPVADTAFETMTRSIVAAVEQEPCDAILLDLHGAMVTESLDDAEGDLLTRVRQAAPDTPIGAALDLHGNITPAMVAAADITIGFKTYPHVDMYETGEHVARIMAQILDNGLQPRQSLIHPPILAQTLKMNTNEACAMTRAVDAARSMETRDGVHAATIFGGFPLSDLAETGVCVVTVADDEALARSAATELADGIWRERDGFVYDAKALSESVASAAEAAAQPGNGPVLMLDHGDNCMSGGTCDVMDVLDESIRQGLTGILAGPIADPEAVTALHAAGPGAQITLEVGNRWALDAIGVHQQPLTLSATVSVVDRGEYTINGPIYTGMHCDMGRAAVLETKQAQVLIVDYPHEPWDMGVFDCVGLEPRTARFLLLKSRMYCRPVFEPLSKAVVECASQGITSSDLELFSFHKLARPIYPLDKEMAWATR